MSHRFVSDSSTAIRTLKSALIGAALVATAYLAALLASIAVAMLDGSGHASDAGAAPSAFASKASQEAAVVTSQAQHDFDYFPDHYTNQSREVAEQPPTF